ncbi:MAG: PilN domain-containing protein [Burkholderiales bacterium]|nr:PilN domain-containing protein [Burkholderiales bacterium]
MSQYINLFGPAFRKPRLLLSLNRAAMLAGLAAVVMIGLQFYHQHQLAGLQTELVSAQGLLKAQSAYTDRLKGETAQKGNTGLAAEVQRLEMELKSARDAMAVLEGGALGNRNGFAGYLQAFSRQALNGLWLTGFTVGGAGEVAIQGRVISPDLLPEYIQKMNREPALKGREFSALEMRRPAVLPAVAGKDGEKTAAAAPRYLEFNLTTGEPGDGADKGGEKR